MWSVFSDDRHPSHRSAGRKCVHLLRKCKVTDRNGIDGVESIHFVHLAQLGGKSVVFLELMVFLDLGFTFSNH